MGNPSFLSAFGSLLVLESYKPHHGCPWKRPSAAAWRDAEAAAGLSSTAPAWPEQGGRIGSHTPIRKMEIPSSHTRVCRASPTEI